MAEYPHLDKAPIAEAILDIRVEGAGADALAATQALAAGMKESFPAQRPIQAVAAVFQMGPGKAPKAAGQTAPLGWICWNTEQTRAVQVRTDGFSVNHVRRYGRWEELRGLAREMWPRYVETVKPATVVRMALRYINRLEFSPGEDLSAQLHTKPLLGPGLPQLLGESFMRTDVSFGNGRRAFITEAVQPGTTPETGTKLLLDIDANVVRRLAPSAPEIWDELEALHAIKNDCFFKSIREETWRRYL